MYRLSDGIHYIEKGCLSASALGTALLQTQQTFDWKVYQYFCNADDCNSSNSLKISAISLITFVFISIINFF